MHRALVFILSFSLYYCHAGFVPETKIFGKHDFLSIGQLKRESSVLSYDITTHSAVKAKVDAFCKYTVMGAYKVNFEKDISFVAAAHQQVMLYGSQLWCSIEKLKIGDQLFCYGNLALKVKSIEALSNTTTVIEISVIPSHTFFITSAGILVHNSPIAVFAIAPSVAGIISKIIGAGVIGGFLCHLFNRKNNESKKRLIYDSSSFGGSSPSPKKPDDDDEFKRKHPHGRYEDVGYHKNHQSGRKSPRPLNGQEALDNSVKLKDASDVRIGVSSDQIVMLRKTAEGLYHGYVVEWKQLEDWMRKILINNNLVNKLGKIILCKPS